jgi:hypothetical protein
MGQISYAAYLGNKLTDNSNIKQACIKNSYILSIIKFTLLTPEVKWSLFPMEIANHLIILTQGFQQLQGDSTFLIETVTPYLLSSMIKGLNYSHLD